MYHWFVDAYFIKSEGATKETGKLEVNEEFTDLNDRFSIRLDAEDYFYDLDATLEDPDAGNSLLLRRFQSDLVLSAGLSFAVGP